ncbi:hypothetical protein L6267_00010 [Candidatus Parcubacteria bacterium]|nr:hypothetical protein [Candidatus Parcubacteria bacterium]
MPRRINSINKNAAAAGKKNNKAAKPAVKIKVAVKKVKAATKIKPNPKPKPKAKLKAAAPVSKKTTPIKVKTVKKEVLAEKKIIQSKRAEPENKDPKSIVLNAVMQDEKVENKKLENVEKNIKADMQKDVSVGIGEDFKKEIIENEIIKNKVVENEINQDVEKNINADAEKDIENNNKTEQKEDRPLSLYRKIALSFIILTVSLLAVILYFSFVKVSIFLIPNQERLSGNLVIDVFDKDKKAVKAEGGMEILGEVEQVEIEETKTYYAGGIDVIGEEVTGKVTIINNYNKNQPLVATTRMLSGDKLFRIKNTVNVPAGGSIEVEVYAEEPSSGMAIGPASFIIPGLWAGLQDKIYGESKEPMKYSKKIKKHILQSDIDDSVKDLEVSLLAKAEREIGENYQNYDQVIYEIDNNSISREIDGKIGEEKDEFSVSMKTNVVVVAFNEDKIFEKAKQNLFSSLPDDKDLLEINKTDISYDLNNYNAGLGTASLSIGFSGQIIVKDGNSVVDRENILGLNQQQLNDYLNNLPGITVSAIEFYPAFIKKVPNLIDRIEVIIEK